MNAAEVAWERATRLETEADTEVHAARRNYLEATIDLASVTAATRAVPEDLVEKYHAAKVRVDVSVDAYRTARRVRGLAEARLAKAREFGRPA